MISPSEPTRRRFLGSLGVATVGALAGCSDADGSEPTDGATSTERSEPGELDPREANVVGVAATAGESGYEFAVELRHDDAGEDGYADWWQVEQLDGTRLGRRELLHAHPNEQPFERSETIEVPSDVDCVVVRGHDQTHGYGGQAMLLALDSGATRTVDQGSAPDSFESGDCP